MDGSLAILEPSIPSSEEARFLPRAIHFSKVGVEPPDLLDVNCIFGALGR
jgi:hypothetical protein